MEQDPDPDRTNKLQLRMRIQEAQKNPDLEH